MSDIPILIPAAGSASRMRGLDKLTQPVGGQPLLRRQTGAALATGQTVIVTLPPASHPHHAGRLAALAGLPVRLVEIADAAEGLSASIRDGAAMVDAGAAALMILLPDLPDLDQADLSRMIEGFAAAPGRILRATAADGTPGHPVILPRRLFPALADLAGDAGARDILRAEAAAGRVGLLALPGTRAITDLDTPEAWAAWRTAQSTP